MDCVTRLRSGDLDLGERRNAVDWITKFAHRQCVQRWCNEKRDITCEICHQEVGQDS
ncbi:unnamed protein product [Rhodiola kirilowii]